MGTSPAGGFVTGLPAILCALILCIASSAAVANIEKQAESFIFDISEKAFALARDESLSETERLKQYETLLSENADIAWIGRFVLGRYMRQANAAERDQYMVLFRKTILHAFYTHFVGNSDLKLTVDGSRLGKRQKFVFVHSTLKAGGQLKKDVNMVWRTIPSNDSFKIVDLAIEGVSLAITKRKEYGALIRNNNGEIKPLINAMRDSLERLQTTN